MSFAHPLALLGLLLLPLITLLYIWRAQHQRQVVSSTWLWSEALARFSHRPTRRLPIREPLLLLQLLATLLLSVGLAGPGLNRPARTHYIVVLDDSATMASTDLLPSRFAQAQRRVHALVAGLGGDDSLSLVLAGPRARLVGEAPGAVPLDAQVDALPAPAGAADLSGAAALARGLAAASGRGAARVLFLAGAQTPGLPLTGLPVASQRFGGALDDQGISRLAARCRPGTSTCQAFMRVLNTAGAARSDTLVIRADGHLLGQQGLSIPARGSLDIAFPVPAGARTLEASLLRRDQLAEDNTAWTIVPAPLPLTVLLVSDSPGPLRAALQAVPGLRVQVVGTGGYQDTLAASADAVIMEGLAPDLLPPNPLLLVDPPAGASLLTVRGAESYLPIDQVDSQDPVVAGLDLAHLSITGRPVEAPAWAQVAAGGARGPVVLHGVLDGQRIAVLPWDLSASTTNDPVFPLLVARLMQWLVPEPPPSVAPGASVELPSNVQSVRDPAGTVLTGPLVRADRVGVYTVQDGLGTQTTGEPLFSVPAAEPGDATVAPAQAAIQIGAGGTFPLPLWLPLLLIALLALMAEWWFYSRKT